jgi:hypothetical protein
MQMYRQGRSIKPTCDYRPAALLRREISLSHGPKWKMHINRYIRHIPLSGNAFPGGGQSISGMPPPWIPVSTAMIAKAGAAARHSKRSALIRGQARNEAESGSVRPGTPGIISASLPFAPGWRRAFTQTSWTATRYCIDNLPVKLPGMMVGDRSQRPPVARSSEYPALRRGHWTMGRPLLRKMSIIGCCGQPGGESSQVCCRP